MKRTVEDKLINVKLHIMTDCFFTEFEEENNKMFHF